MVVDSFRAAPVPAAIVLAAGLSTRMGQFKPLLRLGPSTLLGHVLDALRQSGAVGDVVVVTGHRHEEVEAAVARLPGVRCAFNTAYETGEMLSSVRTGIGALGDLAAGGGFLLALADQPAVAAATIRALVQTFHAHPAALAIPCYRGRRGHPLVLPAALVPEILALPGQETLRKVVHGHLADATLVAVDDPWVLEDLDTPEDFARAMRRDAAQTGRDWP
jgi:molybdenum cofactor cytidylyltransferase